MLEQIMLACGLTFVIHFVETITYSLRIAGVRAGRLAVALSLTGMILLVSRTANMVQAPLAGKLINTAKSSLEFELVDQLRLIIFSATLGTTAAMLALPSAVKLAGRVIAHLEEAGSIPGLVRTSATLKKLKHSRSHLRLPRIQMLNRLRIGGIPKRLVLLNVLVSAAYLILRIVILL